MSDPEPAGRGPILSLDYRAVPRDNKRRAAFSYGGAKRRKLAERPFKQAVEALRLDAGEEFRGEGTLAVTKTLLQVGVSYVSGCQGAPISHLIDVLDDAGRHPSRCPLQVERANEAAAATPATRPSPIPGARSQPDATPEAAR